MSYILKAMHCLLNKLRRMRMIKMRYEWLDPSKVLMGRIGVQQERRSPTKRAG